MKKFFYILVVLPLFLVSCSKEEEENAIDPTIFNKNISVGESCTINEVGSISLETPNDFIATINGNKITGNHSGSLTSYCNTDKGRFKLSVTVSPNTTLYVDLAQFLGMSKSNVEKVFGKPIKTTSQHCVYAPSGLEKETRFVYSGGKVTSCAIYFDSSYASTLGKHLADRYSLCYTQGNGILYMDSYDIDNAKTFVMVQTSLKTILVFTQMQKIFRQIKRSFHLLPFHFSNFIIN